MPHAQGRNWLDAISPDDEIRPMPIFRPAVGQDLWIKSLAFWVANETAIYRLRHRKGVTSVWNRPETSLPITHPRSRCIKAIGRDLSGTRAPEKILRSMMVFVFFLHDATASP